MASTTPARSASSGCKRPASAEPMSSTSPGPSRWSSASSSHDTRLGRLIANLSWRSPVLVARAAAAIDQVSGGRFELGLGAGAFDDQAIAVVLEMPPGERVARLAEGAAVIDRLLRGGVTPFVGRFTRYEAASMAPGCVQAPRPSITIAANGAGALRVAARYADGWNTWGGLELPG